MRHRNRISYYYIFSVLVLFFSCDIAENKIEPEATFSKIYDDSNFQESYDPLDIKQTPDSGYLVLSSRDKWNISILKLEKSGKVQNQVHMPAPFANALPNLLEIDESYYFFCMHEISLQTYLMKINEGTWEAEIVKTFDITYPLATSQAPENVILLQSYDREGRRTKLTKIDANFNISWEATYPILEDKEEPIVSHLTRIGKRLPFFTGFTGEGAKAEMYYLNGFYNFSFSFIFVSVNSGEFKGVVSGYQDKGAISAATYLSGHKMALSRYSFEDNYLLPQSEINPDGNHFTGDLKGVQLPELSFNAPVKIKKLNVAGKDVLLFASDTKSNQIVLYAYDFLTGQLLGTRYWGEKFPYKIASFTSTSDGGLAIIGKTFVAGKFSRLFLVKLSSGELSDLVN